MKSNYELIGDDEIIYMNTSIYNDTQDFINNTNFAASRNQGILPGPANEFNVSIVRFKVPSALIPTILFEPQPGFLINAWSSSTTYNINDIISYLGTNYKSIQVNNLNHIPSSSPLFWSVYSTPINTDPNLGIYSITYSYQGVDKQVFLRLEPGEGFTMVRPTSWLTVNPNNYLYYYISTYTYFMDLVNSALYEGYYYCQNHAPFNTAPPFTQGCNMTPYLVFDQNTGIFSLRAHQTFSSIFVEQETIKIYMNTPLLKLFNSLYIVYDQIYPGGGPNGKTGYINIYDQGDNYFTRQPPVINFFSWDPSLTYNNTSVVSYNFVNYKSLINGNINNQPNISPLAWMIVPSTIIYSWDSSQAYVIGDIVVLGQGTYYIALRNNTNVNPSGTLGTPPEWKIYNGFDLYQMDEEYAILQTWSILKSIIFSSSSLPFNSEQEGVSLGSNPLGTFNGNFFPIITDFEPTIAAASDNRTYLQYAAQGPYRLTNLVGSDRINYLDYQVYWSDDQGNIYPLFIDIGETVTAKFLFQKKKLRS